jgi:hypothetical protein
MSVRAWSLAAPAWEPAGVVDRHVALALLRPAPCAPGGAGKTTYGVGAPGYGSKMFEETYADTSCCGGGETFNETVLLSP